MSPKKAIIISIDDPPLEEEATDSFRPRYMATVQVLDEHGDKDDFGLLYLPLPAWAVGDGSGFYGFPEVGSVVIIQFCYDSAEHAFISNILPDKKVVPSVSPGEILLQQQDGNFLKANKQGWVLQTDEVLTFDSLEQTVITEELKETLGKEEKVVTKSSDIKIGGSLKEEVSGSVVISSGSDIKLVAIGNMEQISGNNKSDSAVLEYKITAGTKITLTGVDIDLMADNVNMTCVGFNLIAESASFTTSSSIDLESLSINLGSEGQALTTESLLTWLSTHTHTCTAPGSPSSPPNEASTLATDPTLKTIVTKAK